MKVNVFVVGMGSFTNKKGKTSYVVDYLIEDNKDNHIGYRAGRAFTSEKHFKALQLSIMAPEDMVINTGYLTFEDGFTKFYLPKDEVNSNG